MLKFAKFFNIFMKTIKKEQQDGRWRDKKKKKGKKRGDSTDNRSITHFTACHVGQ